MALAIAPLAVAAPAAAGRTAAPQTVIAPVYSSQVGGSARAQMYPSGLDVGPDGTVYIADTGNDGAQAYSPNGTLKWKNLSWGRANVQFSEPRDVAYLNGKIYVADTGNNRIQVLNATTGAWLVTWPTRYTAIMGISAGVDATGHPVILGTDAGPGVDVVRVHNPSTGTVIRTVGSGFGAGNGQLGEPRDAATDSAGDIYVADFRNHRVAIFSASGAWIGSFGSVGSQPGQFEGPYGIALDAANRIYVTDANTARIEQFSSSHTYLATFGGVSGTGPGQFFQLRRAVVGAGTSPKVYAADLWGNKITIFNPTGSLNSEIGKVQAPTGGFNKPYGLAMSSSGTLYVADTTNQRVESFTSTGTYLSTFGNRGYAETPDGMNWPHDVAVNPSSGMIWLADTKNDRLVEYNPDGTEAGHRIGTLGSGRLQFNWPWAVTVLADGDLLVADTWNNRVMRITPGATPGAEITRWTTTGFNRPKAITVVGTTAYIADDLNTAVKIVNIATGAVTNTITNPALHDPQGVAVDPAGDIWVSDSAWDQLLDFTPAGALRQTVKPTGSGALSAPGKLLTRTSGSTTQLYVTDTGHDRIAIFTIH